MAVKPPRQSSGQSIVFEIRIEHKCPQEDLTWFVFEEEFCDEIESLYFGLLIAFSRRRALSFAQSPVTRMFAVFSTDDEDCGISQQKRTNTGSGVAQLVHAKT